MNFPVVMLFICFSTAWSGLICKTGGVDLTIEAHGHGASVNPINSKECPLNTGATPLCIRQEYISPTINPNRGTGYFCPGDEPKLCKDKSDGHCNNEEGTLHGVKMKVKTCCSSDPIFRNVPSLFSDDSSSSDKSADEASTPSSTFSTRVFLAIITVLLGLIL